MTKIIKLILKFWCWITNKELVRYYYKTKGRLEIREEQCKINEPHIGSHACTASCRYCMGRNDLRKDINGHICSDGYEWIKCFKLKKAIEK